MRRPLCYLAVSLLVALYLCFPVFEKEKSVIEGWEICQGTVVSKEYQNNQLIIYLKDISIQNQNNFQYEGALLKLNTKYEPKLYSRIMVEGRIEKFSKADNPGEFDSSEYYKIQKLDFSILDAKILRESKSYSKYHEFLYSLKIKSEKIFDELLNSKDSAIMKALVLGNKKNLDKSQKQLFQNNGISHIMAISGLHISLLGMTLYKLLKKVKCPAFICTFLPLFIIFSYGNMIGTSSSALRAIIMISMKIIADYLGRRFDIYTAMAFSCILVLVEQPLYLKQAGFLLSFSAILGVSILPEIIKTKATRKEKNKIKKYLYGSILANLSIFLMQLPIVLYFFYEYPVISFLMNLIILPVIPLLITMGIALLPYYYAQVVLGALPEIIHILLMIMNFLCSLSTKVPQLMWTSGRPGKINIILYYMIMFVFCFALKRRAKQEKEINKNIKLIVFCFSILILGFRANPKLQITYLSVGQGNCACISDNRGHNFLIDCGSVTKNRIGEYTLIPYLKYSGITSLDGVFLTHLDQDHISGIEELISTQNKIKIKQIFISESVIKDDSYKKMISLCKKNNIKTQLLKSGDELIYGKLKYKILYPHKGFKTSDRNEYSLVIELSMKNFVALFPGDVTAQGELEIANKINRDYKCDVFLATHHGSRYSNTDELLKSIKPTCTIISCGKNNSYGHPHKEALERIKKIDSTIYKTMIDGAITVTSNGNTFHIDTFH